MAFKKKVEATRNETALHCRTLMRDHQWLVPEQERPELAPPPREQTKTDRIVDKLFDDRGRSHLPHNETVQRMKARYTEERPDRRSTPPSSPGRSVIR
jgi:hypothetical protein